MALFRPRYSHAWMLAAALACYALAKAAEMHDAELFSFAGMSGHSLKHLLAAAACFTVLWMLRIREP
jgi:hypothetical protein